MASPGLTGEQAYTLLLIERVTSVFSLVGCAFIFATFVFSKKFRRPVNRLIFFASLGNISMGVATVMSTTPVFDPDGALCQFQAFLIQMFLPADALWNLSMAINVYLTTFHHWDARKLKRLEPTWFATNYFLPFIVAFAYCFISNPQSGKIYGGATLWCWVRPSWDGFRIYLVYAPAWATIAAIVVLYTISGVELFKRQRRFVQTTERSQSAAGAGGFTFDDPFTAIKTTEVQVTSELHCSYPMTDMRSPSTTLDPTMRRPSQHNLNATPGAGLGPHDASGTGSADVSDDEYPFSPALFNPFKLNPGLSGYGYDPYTVTISHGTRSVHGPTMKGTDKIARIHARQQEVAMIAHEAAWGYIKVALLYFVSLLITWVPSSMNRVWSLANEGSVSYGFNLAAGIVLPLMGFWNTVIYIVTSWDAVCALVREEKAGPAVLSGGRGSRRKWQELNGVESGQKKGDDGDGDGEGEGEGKESWRGGEAVRTDRVTLNG